MSNDEEKVSVVRKPEPTVCWMAYHNDFSDVAVFDTEVRALRYAIDNYMKVIELKAGSATEQINAKLRP